MVSTVSVVLLLCLGTLVASDDNPRIVGGDPTTIQQYPSIVQIEFRPVIGFSWSHSCAGNILTSRWILSAAHCFVGVLYSPNLRRIRAGTTNRNSGGIVINVLREVNHPSYRVASTHDGDVTVVELQSPLVFSPSIAAATITAPGFDPPTGLPVVHAGWGAIYSNGPASNVLQHVTIYTIDRALCRQRYGSTWPTSQVVTDNMICAGILDVGGQDACQGDSGGPLYYNDILIGVVSWGRGCADAHFPGVSAAVSPYTNWIIETVQG